jgi:predicted outer membrane repeat protein
MINYKVYNKAGTLLYEVSSKSKYCLKNYLHVSTGLNGKKLVFKYDNTIHNLVPAGTSISDETELYQYLYNSKKGSENIDGKLTNDISLSANFFSWHKTNHYPTISTEKNLSGKFSIFPNTTAYTSSADKYIFKSDLSLTLQNLTISGFTNPYLNIVDVSSLELTISGCSFINNDVGVNINVDNSRNTTHIINSTFKSLKANKLKANGPRLVQSNKKVKINRRNNGQTNDTTGEEKWSPGSAIRYKGEMLYITDSSFVDNSNSYAGGAIYAETYLKTLTLSGENLFSRNITMTTDGFTHGGAICIVDANETIVNNGMATFNSNIAGYGGAIYSESPAMSGGTYTFSDNCANLQDGGAIYAYDISITDGSYTFNGNIASNYGGAITANSKMTITDGSYTFKGNIANIYGGAIHAYSKMTITGGTYTFSDNCANINGGAIYATDDISITDGSYTFNGNIANSNGGAIHSRGTVDISTVKLVSFFDNSSNSKSDQGNHIYTKDICYNYSSNVWFDTPDCSGSYGSAVWSTDDAHQICPPQNSQIIDPSKRKKYPIHN